jgi:hypothetical protein
MFSLFLMMVEAQLRLCVCLVSRFIPHHLLAYLVFLSKSTPLGSVTMMNVSLCVLGGPAVGDIRSRCLRLSDESTSEALSLRRLLGHRLPLDPSEAKLEW